MLFHTRMAFSQLLMVTDGRLKLDYASVIFVDTGYLPYARSLVVNISARLWRGSGVNFPDGQ